MRFLITNFKHPGVFAFCLGGLGALALAPFHYWFLLLISLSGLLILLDRLQGFRSFFATIWWWCFAHFLVSFHWVSFSLGVDFERFFWVLPLSLLGLPAFLALIPSLVCGLGVSRSSSGLGRWALFAAAWGAVEWIRGTLLFGGFPWNLMGYAWGDTVAVLQILSWLGPYGLSTLTVLFLSSPYLIFVPSLPLFRKTFWGSCVCVTALAIIFWGELRLKPVTFVPGCWMRLVQPNVMQQLKWKTSFQGQQIQDLFTLSGKPSANPLTHILWPECALPFVLEETDMRHGRLLSLRERQVLLAGVLRATRGRGGRGYVWNSLMILDSRGETLGCYDKAHLVPFGEYIPLRALLSQFIGDRWLQKMTVGTQDIAAGPGPRTLDVPGAPPVSPLVCFDVAFPGEVVSSKKRPGWLLDITNDAWFKDSWGLAQHFEMGKFRAVEEGIPLVRVANSGISGVIDPYGRRLDDLPALTQLTYDFALPQALAPTFYSRWREIPFWGFLLLLLGGGLWEGLPLWAQRSRKRSSEPKRSTRTPKKPGGPRMPQNFVPPNRRPPGALS